MTNVKPRPTSYQRPRLDPNAIWEDRTALVKREAQAERLAAEAKTARLRSLRLEKEAAKKADGEATGVLQSAPTPHRRKGTLTIKV